MKTTAAIAPTNGKRISRTSAPHSKAITIANGFMAMATNSQNEAARQREPLIAAQAAIIAAVIGTCACTPLKLSHAAGILISSGTPASAIASIIRRSRGSIATVSIVQAHVKKAAPSSIAEAAAVTRSSSVKGT